MNTLVSAKTIIFRDDGKFLTLRRTETAPHHPLGWDFPGGIIDEGETIEDGVIREIKEEAGIEITDLNLLGLTSRILDSGKLYIPVMYAANAKSENITLSYEHDQFRWVTSGEFLKLGAAKKLKDAVEKLVHESAT